MSEKYEIRKVYLDETSISWTLVDESLLPLPHVEKWIKFLENRSSPHTVENYTRHLKKWFEFLSEEEMDWKKDVNLDSLSSFQAYLRNPNTLKIRYINNIGIKGYRKGRTVNTICAAVISFYDYHTRINTFEKHPLQIYETKSNRRQIGNYRNFLDGINRSQSMDRNVLKVPEEPSKIELLRSGEVETVLNACSLKRDLFLLTLLYETGIRISQARGLRHEDIHSWDNKILIIRRLDNSNNAISKDKEILRIDTSKELMLLYAAYLTAELYEIDSDYVFVTLKGDTRGRSMTKSGVDSLFKRISKKTGIKVTPHMFRHTHATEMIKDGVPIRVIQKRLGHRSVSTTMDTYTHYLDDEIKEEIRKFREKKLR